METDSRLGDADTHRVPTLSSCFSECLQELLDAEAQQVLMALPDDVLACGSSSDARRLLGVQTGGASALLPATNAEAHAEFAITASNFPGAAAVPAPNQPGGGSGSDELTVLSGLVSQSDNVPSEDLSEAATLAAASTSAGTPKTSGTMASECEPGVSDFASKIEGERRQSWLPSRSDQDNMSADEQRRHKRRMANRESAQRVRQKRRLLMSQLQEKVDEMTQETRDLAQRVADAEAARDKTAAELASLKSQLAAEVEAKAKLEQEGAFQKPPQVQPNWWPQDGGKAALPAQTSSYGAATAGGSNASSCTFGAGSLPAVSGSASCFQMPAMLSQWQYPVFTGAGAPVYSGAQLPTPVFGGGGLPHAVLHLRGQHCRVVSSGASPLGRPTATLQHIPQLASQPKHAAAQDAGPGTPANARRPRRAAAARAGKEAGRSWQVPAAAFAAAAMPPPPASSAAASPFAAFSAMPFDD